MGSSTSRSKQPELKTQPSKQTLHQQTKKDKIWKHEQSERFSKKATTRQEEKQDSIRFEKVVKKEPVKKLILNIQSMAPSHSTTSKESLLRSNTLTETQHNQQNEKQKAIKRITITDLDRIKGQKYMFQKYCLVFQLVWNSKSNLNNTFKQLKSKYRQLISKYHNEKILRKCINEAYELICHKIFNVKYSEEELKLILAVIRQDENQLNKLFYQDPQLINFRFKGTNYPLIYFAVRSGSYQISQLILSKNSKFDFSEDKSTPMHCASYYGFHDLIGLLVQFGIPLNIKNSSGNLPLEQARDEKMKTLLKNAQKDRIHQFISRLTNEGLCQKTFNIEDKFEVIAKKIILNFSQQNPQDYVDAFHGTPFQNFYSIAKYGLKKAGDKAGDKVIQIVDRHIKNQSWAKNVFVSPSIFYSGCDIYAKQIQFLNTINNTSSIWLPIVQVKVKKDAYKMSKSTTPSHRPLRGQPKYVEYIIGYDNQEEANEKFSVFALIFVKKWYLRSKKAYDEAHQIILNSPKEKMWRRKLQAY